MKAKAKITILIVGAFAIVSSCAVAAERVHFSAFNRRVYNACLFRSWIADYCKFRAYRNTSDYRLDFQVCMMANVRNRYRFDERIYRGYYSESRDICWHEAQTGVH